MDHEASNAGVQTLSRRNSHVQIKLGDMPSLNNCVRLTYGHRNLLMKLNSVESTESAGHKPEQYSRSPEHQNCLGSEVPTKNTGGCGDDWFFNHEENHNITDLDNNADLRHEKNQQVSQPFLRGEPIPTTIGGWDWRLCESISPAQPLHTEIIGIHNLQVTKSHSQNNPEIIGAVHSITGSNPVQPFGSMPRLFNSALPNSFSQLARLTPSCLASLSNCSFNSGGIRIWNAGALPVPLGCLSRLMIVDMYAPITVVFFQIGTHLITMLSIKTTPPNGITSTERGLTTTVSESNEAAMKDHITHPQGRKSYTWRFLALSAIGRNVIHITATTEREAREQSPAGCVMVFAGRLPVREVHRA